MAEAVPPMDANAKPHTLDDLMVAMDVVDELRHREDLVRRELDATGRESDLIGRLREIYLQQGIEVPDHVLAEGVKALRESRFTYTPPPPSWKRSLLELWPKRRRIGFIAAGVLAAIVAVYGFYYLTVTRPARLAAERTRIELTQTLPEAIRRAHADVIAVATDPTVKERAGSLLTDASRAIRDKDRAAMVRARDAFRRLHEEVARRYVLTIVSRPGETTGVWRRPPGGSSARNYYLIVEAIAPDGKKLQLPVRSEETGEIKVTDRFGVRVSKATFDAVAADKRDDGIIQKNRFAEKRRGTLEPNYLMPFLGGMITKW